MITLELMVVFISISKQVVALDEILVQIDKDSPFTSDSLHM